MTADEFNAKFGVQPAAPDRPRYSADDECRVCQGSGLSDCDGVYGRCWCCNGSGARGAATLGPYIP